MMVRAASTVQVAPLTRRFVASLIDLAPLVALGVLAAVLPAGTASTRSLLVGVATGVGLAWLIFLWGRYAITGAGPGYQTLDLSLRDVDDGEPIGWIRFLLRQLVLIGLSITVVGAVILLVTIMTNPRGRGWHDRIAGSIAVYRPRHDQAGVPTPAWQPTDEADAQRWAPPPPQVSASSAPEADGSHREQPEFTSAAVAAAPAAQTVAPARVSPSAPPVPVPPPKGAVLVPPPDAYQPPPSGEGDPLSAETPILPESAREEALEAARQRGWLPLLRDGGADHGVPDSEESTRLSVEQPGDYGWYLVLDDGRQVDVSRPLVIGRNPIPPAERPNALAVRVGETGQAVSKTHLAVSVDGSGLFVVDLGSTNGTAVVGTTGALEPCKAQREVRVRDGQVVSFGDHAFTVRRRSRH